MSRSAPINDDVTVSTKDSQRELPESVSKDSRIIIVGAGCFGLSTAYHLLLRGYRDITVLDKSSNLPAPDSASNDINRIVRSSYGDKFYAELARQAIIAWKDKEFWGDTYHESGVLVLGNDNAPSDPERIELHQTNIPIPIQGDDVIPVTGSTTYTSESFANDLALGCKLIPLPDPSNIRSTFPIGIRTGSFESEFGATTPNAPRTSRRIGYLNCDGGWADAGQGVKILLDKVIKLGAKVHSGKSVLKIKYEQVVDGDDNGNGKVNGVICMDGTEFDTDVLVIATGSWTPSAFKDLDLQESLCLATGQCVAMIQLTEEEARLYKDCPVILDFSSGFYIFPPTSKHVIKMAIHGPGYTHKPNGSEISIPRTITSNPENGLSIPKPALQQLRNNLREIYPDLAEKPFSNTRLCWYNDASDGDWVIGRHQAAHNLILATAGSGHAYKFLPIIGRLVVDLIENKLDPKLVNKFAVNRVTSRLDGSRSGQATELDLGQLCSRADLDDINNHTYIEEVFNL